MLINIPSALTHRETALLQSMAFDRHVLEAGALLGYSTVALAQVAKHVTSYDPHMGYPAARPSPTWNIFNHNITCHGVSEQITAHRMSFEECLDFSSYDMAFADMTGRYAITSKFLELTSHIPIVGIHDYERNNCHGATNAVNDYILSHKLTRIERVDTLIILHNKI